MTTTQRIAGAPISWGVSEVPGWGHQMRRERVLAELRELGLAATEAGPDGFLPDDPGALRELLAGYDLKLASRFTPLVLHGEASAWRRDLTSVAARFATGGASIIVLAASTGLDDYDARPQLTNADWLRSCERWTRHARWPVDTGSRSHSILTTERWSRLRKRSTAFSTARPCRCA
jgi:inosose dehydratase